MVFPEKGIRLGHRRRARDDAEGHRDVIRRVGIVGEGARRGAERARERRVSLAIENAQHDHRFGLDERLGIAFRVYERLGFRLEPLERRHHPVRRARAHVLLGAFRIAVAEDADARETAHVVARGERGVRVAGGGVQRGERDVPAPRRELRGSGAPLRLQPLAVRAPRRDERHGDERTRRDGGLERVRVQAEHLGGGGGRRAEREEQQDERAAKHAGSRRRDPRGREGGREGAASSPLMKYSDGSCQFFIKNESVTRRSTRSRCQSKHVDSDVMLSRTVMNAHSV